MTTNLERMNKALREDTSAISVARELSRISSWNFYFDCCEDTGLPLLRAYKYTIGDVRCHIEIAVSGDGEVSIYNCGLYSKKSTDEVKSLVENWLKGEDGD